MVDVDLIIQICPIGFELQRIIAGVQFHPANLIYLLESDIKSKDYKKEKDRKLDEKLVDLSKYFTGKLKDVLGPQKIETAPCSFIRYQEMVRDLCAIMKDIHKKKADDDQIKEIWINVSTGTKLFVAAAMFLASFKTEIIHLFYVNAQNYTINMVLDDDTTKEQIKDTYEKKGISYSNNGTSGYKIVDIPVVPSEQVLTTERKILTILYEKVDDEFKPDWVNLEAILENFVKNLHDMKGDAIRAIKMKYRHNFTKLLERELIEEEKHGRRKRYKLTDRGVIMAIIQKCIAEISPDTQDEDE